MKNTQICPICGKEIDFVDDYSYFKHKSNYSATIKNMFTDKDRVGMCRKCESPIYNTNRKKIPLQLVLSILGLIVIISISIYKKDVLFFFVVAIVYWIVVNLWWNYSIFYSNRKRQHFVTTNKLKSVFCANFISDKKSNELFENNILEIKDGTQKCKVIVTKKVDESQYTFGFVEYEKDVLKQMLEKDTIFQLTNGVDILGNLEVTTTYPI